METSITKHGNIASMQGSADGPFLMLQCNAFKNKILAIGDPLQPNHTLSYFYFGCERSSI